MLVMGFMSGTSLDGVDVAMLETDGEAIDAFGPALLMPFRPDERDLLITATRDALAWNGNGPSPLSFAEAERAIHAAHVRAGLALIQRGGARPDVVGFLGQTVLHRPHRALSVQLGDAQALADAIGAPVVAKMRQDDLRAGGQGAPLVPPYHAALADRLGLARPAAFLNLGGVANLTWLGPDGELVAFDTGPANGLIDWIVQQRGAGQFDEGGRLARTGRIDHEILADLLDHEYFRRVGAKSLDRYDFSLDWAQGRKLEDVVATLTAFTVESIGLAARQLPVAPSLWVVCGGGCRNPVLMEALRKRLGNCRDAESLGLRSDFIEAEAIGFLAARSLRGLPLTYPGTTGVPAPLTGGIVSYPVGYQASGARSPVPAPVPTP